MDDRVAIGSFSHLEGNGRARLGKRELRKTRFSGNFLLFCTGASRSKQNIGRRGSGFVGNVPQIRDFCRRAKTFEQRSNGCCGGFRFRSHNL